MPVKLTRPNNKLRAYLRLRGEDTSRSFFAVIPGGSVGQSRTKASPRLGPSGASTSPESGFAVSDSGELVSRKIAKSGEEISIMSISSGGLSGTTESRIGAERRFRYGSTLKSGLLHHSSRACGRVIWQEAGVHRRDSRRASRTIPNTRDTRNGRKQPRGTRI